MVYVSRLIIWQSFDASATDVIPQNRSKFKKQIVENVLDFWQFAMKIRYPWFRTKWKKW
jgi:hypothetical protein